MASCRNCLNIKQGEVFQKVKTSQATLKLLAERQPAAPLLCLLRLSQQGRDFQLGRQHRVPGELGLGGALTIRGILPGHKRS